MDPVGSERLLEQTTPRRCVRYGTWALWFASWWGLKCLVLDQDASVYLLCMSLAVHVRIPPPLGQVPPLMDPLLVYVQGWSSFFCLLFGGLAVQSYLSRGDASAMSNRGHWYLLSCLSCGASSYRRLQDVEHTQRSLRVTTKVTVKRPWLTKLHPYLYYFFHSVPGHSTDVVIERRSPAGLHVPLDLWYVPSTDSALRPVLFLIHGGAWRGGEARCSPQAPLLQSLAASGFLILSCEYRRRGAAWPMQLEDCSAALEWLINEGAALYRADPSDVTLAGTSAGGHLAALLLTKLLQDAKFALLPRAAMLFYPALDPSDRFTNSTVRLPFSCSPLGVRYKMSALEWFFQLIVLHGNEDLWPSAEPMRQLERVDRDCISRWPPTLIVHGDCDGIVPIEHSAHFLRCLESWAAPSRREDQLLRVPGGRHTFESVYGDLSDCCYNAALSWLQKIRGSEHSLNAKPAMCDP